MTDQSDLLSRERLAGYDPDRLRAARVLLVGAGALGNNVAQTLALSGVGETSIVDFDVVELSNATRSPLFPRAVALGGKRRSKARELAHAVHRTSYADAPVVRYAVTRVEALGLGFLRRCDVVIAAVDSFRARAWLADATRLVGVPMVEGGFSGSRGQVSVYPNDTAEAPCYRCLNPATEGGVSCSLYARNVAAEGRTPATQSIAALTGAYVAEAVIRLLHPGGSPLGGKMLTFDVGIGRGAVLSLARDPECPGVHRTIGETTKLSVQAKGPAASILGAIPELADPELLLPHEYLVSAPCTRCGKQVHVGRPEWAVLEPPACTRCDGAASDKPPASLVTASRVRLGDQLTARAARKLGIAPMDIVEVMARSSGESVWVELAGTDRDLFVTLPARERLSASSEPEFSPVAVPSDGDSVSAPDATDDVPPA